MLAHKTNLPLATPW